MTSDKPEKVRTLFALDFDGVLVDSAAETGHSGWLAAKTLWPDAPWMTVATTTTAGSDNKTTKQPPSDLIERFRQVRPCLETGWEASLIIRLLADSKYGLPSNNEILDKFQSIYKEQILHDSKLIPEQCNQALKQARNDWIAQNNGQDWIQAHGFFEGACKAVRRLLDEEGSENVYIITTKAKEFALRLLEQQQLCVSDTSSNSPKKTMIPADHVYGLGSGPKATVLHQLISKQKQPGENCLVAVMVEDNLSTLHKIVANPELQGLVLPALASWGYNTSKQQQQATNDHFVILDDDDDSEGYSLSRVLDSKAVPILLQDFDKHYYQKHVLS